MMTDETSMEMCNHKALHTVLQGSLGSYVFKLCGGKVIIYIYFVAK